MDMKRLADIFMNLFFPLCSYKALFSTASRTLKNLKSFERHHFSPAIFLLPLLLFASLHAAQIANDTFSGSTDGYTGSGVSSSGGWLRINRDKTATKTYNFGTTYANQTLSFSIRIRVPNAWENSGQYKDYFRIRVNGTQIQAYSYSGGTHTETFTANADASGNVVLSLNPDTTADDEFAEIDYVRIDGTSSSPSCSTLRDSDDFTAAHTSYTNAAHYNDSDWNVGPNASAMSRAYHFTVDGPGTVDIDLTRIDRDQASFSVAQGNCPSTLDNLKSSQLTFSAAGDFYVYIYYINGSHTNIEHQLDVVFTPNYANAVDDSFTTTSGVALSENVLTNDNGSGITVTGNTSPANGTLVIQSDGSFTYTPNSNFSGQDTFEYTITDSNGMSDDATVTITVGSSFTSGSSMPFQLINPDYSRNMIGDYAIAGNTVLCLTEKTSGFGGTCKGDDSSYQSLTSNMRVSKFLDIDSDDSTWNSTSSNITLPASYHQGRGIVWAGLFWQGRIAWDHNYRLRYGVQSGSSYNWVETGSGTSVNHVDVSSVGAPDLKLKVDTGDYEDVHAATFHTYQSSNGQTYAAYADVTSVIQNANLDIGKHTFTVANLTTEEGREPSPGVFGGWSLVVIYAEDYSLGKPRNISIYNGFEAIKNPSDPITISGFKLPSNSTVHAKLSTFSGEGEYRYGRTPSNSAYDWMKISDNYGSGYDYMPGKPSGTALGNRDNMFDAQLDGIDRDHIDGEYNDQSVNNDGVDVDSYDVSDLMTDYRQANPNISTVYIQMSSNNDYITPSMIAFSAELYVPELCYDYTLDIGGYVLNSTNNQVKTRFGSFGVPLTTKVYIRSLEGDIDLYDVNVTYNIHNTNQLQYTYNSCSTEISENGFYNYSNACPYTVNADASGFSMYIGTNKTPTSGGIISALEERYIKFDSNFMTSNVNTSFDFGIDYMVNYGSGGVPLHQDFTASDLCPSGGGGFTPTYGLFNIINGSAPTYDEYNLYTQTAGRPFGLQVWGHDKTTPTDLVANDLNLTVEVELIRADNFARDADVACNDAKGIIPGTTSKFTHFNSAKNTYVQYDTNDINFAYRSVAARVWYLVHDDGSLVNDHNCSRDNQQECADLYARDFAAAHECDTECDPSASGCWECLRGYHGEKSCSRDNFAIRPESFVTMIVDSNQSEDVTQASNLVTYSGSSVPGTPPKSANIVAGYQYRFDVNATSHINDEAVSQYRAAFIAGGLGQRAQMQWYPSGHTVSNCNDVTDKNISLNLFDGSSINYHTGIGYVEEVDQIGKYRFEIYDENWTAADWDVALTAHHTGTNRTHFVQGTDCAAGSDRVLPSNTPIASNNKNGCIIQSVHTNEDTGAVYDYMYLRYHPYKYDVTGLLADIRSSGSSPVAPNDFIYMNTPGTNDQNMSYNIHGTFKAVGYTGYELNNFVTDCYAEDTAMTLEREGQSASTWLTYDVADFNTSNPSTIIRSHEQGTFSGLPLMVTQNAVYFKKDMKGAITMDLGYNYDRVVNQPVNPRFVHFSNLSFAYVSNPPISVDRITDHHVSGTLPLDHNITFIYGRVHAPRYRVECSGTGNCSTATSPNQPLKFYTEFYYDAAASVEANSTLTTLSQEADRSVDSIRWYTNTQHNEGRDGNITSVIQRYVTTSPISRSGATLTFTSGVAFDDFEYDSSSEGYPYKATMQIISQPWLIYNRFDDSATANDFELEFNAKKLGGATGGVDDSNMTSPNTSRRIRW